MKKHLSLLLMVFCLLLLPCPFSLANDPPAPPAGYYGQVYYDGTAVNAGQVEALVDEQVQGTMAISSGKYGNPPNGPYLIVSSSSGKTVRFKVTIGSTIFWAQESVPWVSGGPQEVNLYGFSGQPPVPPVFQGISCSRDNLTITLSFDKLLDSINEASLKQSITIKKDGDTVFKALAGGDQVSIHNNDLIITLASPIQGQNNEIKVAANTVKTAGQAISSDLVQKIPIEGCFIATAAFGSYLDKHVWVLRQFRDQVLLSSSWGRWFVNEYYRYSPPIALIIADSPPLKMLVRALLIPIIYAIRYPGLIVGLLGMGLVWLAYAKIRNRAMSRMA